MNGSRRAALLGLLLVSASVFCTASCSSPGPRVPFGRPDRWMLLAGGSERWLDDRYVHGYTPLGLEFVTQPSDSAGWSWEIGARYGEDEGNDKESAHQVVFFDTDMNGTFETRVDYVVAVPAERKTQIWEVNVGVRQTYFRDARVQPYFGVGGSLLRVTTEDDFESVVVDSPVGPLALRFASDHGNDNRLGLYLRSGILWQVTGREKGLKTYLSTDLRGLLGHEIGYLELNFGIGIGR